ncbi:MAG: GNAT family N-acetyltransferase [Patescibacteria group bacterium]|nr:GNAT family N-acetyltransferase [Patescibacteria group bacterium]
MILKGQKVTLRPIRLSDAGRFVKWLNNPEIHKFLQTRRHLTLGFERKWIKDSLKKGSSRIGLAIETKDGVHIGSVSLESINNDHRRATFGIFIGEKKYWNQGLGSEAARLVIDYGFKKLKLYRIELGVLEYNPRAKRVYKRLGFRKEGVKRDHIFFQGKYYDEIHMGLLRHEWKN